MFAHLIVPLALTRFGERALPVRLLAITGCRGSAVWA
jgi:hypothetical protein